jgi:putative ABC transport system permease protein
MRTLSVTGARQTLGTETVPLWRRLYLDVILLGLSALVFWKTASTGYQVVLAPEGVPATSVDYTAFLAPVLLWIGAGLLTLRLSDLLLNRGRPLIGAAFGLLAGDLSSAVAASLQRQRKRVGAGVALTAMAFAFAASTAIFNTTYEGQARVDAELTNGSDITATGSTSSPAGAYLKQLSALPGVLHAEGMQHGFAYVGTDLQDLYGIDPATIGSATPMANAYFANGDATKTLQALGRNPSGVLVSDETVKDFQLNQGDTINLRLQGADHQYHVVPFVFAGVTREFPTAPRDSFLIANAAYVAKMTGLDAREIVLMRTDGNVARVHAAADSALASTPGIQVTDLSQASHLIGSSLTAVDLGGLTRLELTYAVLLVAGATGLILALGLADRRRSFAILSVLGAKERALGAFIWSEGAVIAIGGGVAGITVGVMVAQILVQVLQGVFDPPPEHLAIPMGYLTGILAAAAAATTIAILNGVKQSKADPVMRMKELQ